MCLENNPSSRPSSAKLLTHPFITKQRNFNVLVELIARTKAAVRELDNLNYRKMKKILMVDSCENESNLGDTQDEQAGEDSSKSNSITSEHSMNSIGILPGNNQVGFIFIPKPMFKS